DDGAHTAGHRGTDRRLGYGGVAVPGRCEHSAAYRGDVHGADRDHPDSCADSVSDCDAIGDRSGAPGDHHCGEPGDRYGDAANRVESFRDGGDHEDDDRPGDAGGNALAVDFAGVPGFGDVCAGDIIVAAGVGVLLTEAFFPWAPCLLMGMAFFFAVILLWFFPCMALGCGFYPAAPDVFLHGIAAFLHAMAAIFLLGAGRTFFTRRGGARRGERARVAGSAPSAPNIASPCSSAHTCSLRTWTPPVCQAFNS